MGYDSEGARAEIADALACPVPWAKVFQVGEPAYFHPLERLWEEIVKGVAVADERYCFSPIFQLDELDADELKVMQINIRTWRDQARQEYLSRTRRLRELRYADRADYAKHQPPPAASIASVAELSATTRISKFYKNIPANIMLGAFFHGLFFHFDQLRENLDDPVADQALWDALMANSNCRIAFWSPNAIGAVDGHPTQFLCFEIDASTPILHAYPVSEAEADKVRGKYSLIRIDDLRGWGEP